MQEILAYNPPSVQKEPRCLPSEERGCRAKYDELLKRMTRRLQQYQVDNQILEVLQKVFEKEFSQENVVLSSPARTPLFQQVSKAILMDVFGKIGGTK